LRKVFPRLVELQKSLKAGELCLINRLNDHLFSTLCEQDNDLEHLIEFKGSAGYLSVTHKHACLWLDGRYWESHKSNFRNTIVECLPSHGEQGLRDYLKQGFTSIEGHPVMKIFCNTKRWSALDIERYRRVIPKAEWKHRDFALEQSVPLPFRALTVVDVSISGESSECRLKRLQAHIREDRIHFLCNPDDISWLLNLRGDDFPYKRSVNGYALVAKHYAAFFSNLDQRELSLLKEVLPKWLLIPHQSSWRKALTKVIREHPKIQVEVEFHRRPGSINQADYKFLTELLPGRRLIRRKRTLVELGRIEKNPCELLEMEKSGLQLSALMRESIAWVKEQVSSGKKLDEHAIKMQIDRFAKNRGASRPCFPAIVASGEHSSSPHHMHGNRELQIGDLVMLDIGYYFEQAAFATDMTRCFVVGSPSTRQKKIYTQVLRAFLLQWNQCFEPKTLSARDLDAVGRQSLISVEHEGFPFCHSTGHGLGIVDHELGISISSKSKMLLRPNYVYSIEPGCYANEKVKGERFGIRLEDVVVTRESSGRIHHRSLAPCPFEENLIDNDLWTALDQKNYDCYMQAL